MYEFIILAHLMPGPTYAYFIAKIINDMNGPYIKVSNGSLYPVFAKLEQEGFITLKSDVIQENERKQRIYEITSQGRHRFHQLMLDTNTNQKNYQEIFLQKTGFFSFITLEERLHLVDHYIHYCQGNVYYQQSEIADLLEVVTDDEKNIWKREDMVNSMRHLLAKWEIELEWAKKLRERVLAKATQEVAKQNSKI